ncbi:DUF1348 family protein [Streptantibioticus cattleyicolor]|uniref:Uncharacterized protein n=1 Tax=Streptantibioticus cattleyicolor (strain ATCC 35852 / DSM 46488 / JCM 4925 / NBRC 14057 / NRRL 8057) TaxID=1003195 RepID=F8JJE6_STREN|nr:DUF1348 family protein [Streptantibioticus cattleyicolor]AEW98731.1 hypothetical protein SCATT_p05380 [Streptantibioticus cattleyicolor NRRL 8057 = DSM 46488]CCB72216.1 conserved protein of unknown function [Streptantibioticus cattleyicolor NRRL 8057 = DSM 46488]
MTTRAHRKAHAADEAWNTLNPEQVALTGTADPVWRNCNRNRDRYITGRDAVVTFLREKWSRELEYALRKELWDFHGDRSAVRFRYAYHEAKGQRWRA